MTSLPPRRKLRGRAITIRQPGAPRQVWPLILPLEARFKWAHCAGCSRAFDSWTNLPTFCGRCARQRGGSRRSEEAAGIAPSLLSSGLKWDGTGLTYASEDNLAVADILGGPVLRGGLRYEQAAPVSDWPPLPVLALFPPHHAAIEYLATARPRRLSAWQRYRRRLRIQRLIRAIRAEAA